IIHGSSNISIGFSAVVCVIAALNLLLDFEFIARQSRLGAPEKTEWIAALGLLVTLIWIYMEILRLLMKLKGRDN
ncbi:MAG: Bax inhibitor-1/YccA family protein, partial [Puniceicoccales bacterium]|nr:Bax inhibitor-1/YccA family protein [Puniceicoccales bacterium]